MTGHPQVTKNVQYVRDDQGHGTHRLHSSHSMYEENQGRITQKIKDLGRTVQTKGKCHCYLQRHVVTSIKIVSINFSANVAENTTLILLCD